MHYSIKNKEVEAYNENSSFEFPKYTSQLINWANQNAHGTRPNVVGQMSELFPEFVDSCDGITIENWRKWYLDRYPNAIEKATEKIYIQVKNLQEAIKCIDRNMVEHWVEDLVFFKTFNGMYVQKAIFASLSEKKGESYRLADIHEESMGIDGYVEETPYSIKPNTYKTMERLPETISVKMIYYTKTKTGLNIEVED